MSEDNVRKAAVALQKAIAEAHAKGLRVDWPSHPDQLSSIAISETGKAKSAAKAPAASEPAAEKPAV